MSARFPQVISLIGLESVKYLVICSSIILLKIFSVDFSYILITVTGLIKTDPVITLLTKTEPVMTSLIKN